MDTAALTEWINADFTFRATVVIFVMILFASGPPLVLAWFLWRIGSRALATRRYPPPGVPMLRSLAPVTGSTAESRGRVLKMFSAFIATSAVLIALLLMRFAYDVWTR